MIQSPAKLMAALRMDSPFDTAWTMIADFAADSPAARDAPSPNESR
jgi:hypothetical protein